MTALAFPESAEDWEAAFNNALAEGVFSDDPQKPTFWAHYEYLATVTEDGGTVVDVFKQSHTLEYVRIPRTEETE